MAAYYMVGMDSPFEPCFGPKVPFAKTKGALPPGGASFFPELWIYLFVPLFEAGLGISFDTIMCFLRSLCLLRS